MRHRLSAATGTLVATLGLSATVVAAQQSEGGGTHVFDRADSDMQGNTVRSEAGQTVVVSGTPSSSSDSRGGSRSGGGGSGSGGGAAPGQAEWEPAPAVVSAIGGPAVPVPACFAEAVEVSEAVLVPFTCTPNDSPAAGPSGAPAADPLVLALRAFSEMTLPAPTPAMNPPLGDGTYAQLATFFYLEDWALMSNSATAGAVTSTATATPVRHTWTIQDTYRGTSHTIACDGRGAPFDPSRAYELQVPPECGWTPRHSSAGQGPRGGSRSEPCFPTEVAMTWDVSWTSNIGPGGDLGVATTTTEVCVVVAELHALVTSYGR